MKKLAWNLLGLVIIAAVVAPLEPVAAQRRAIVRPNRVVHRPMPRRTRLVVRTGHPIRRTLPAHVVFRPARRFVAAGAPLVFLPRIAWRAAVVTLPSSERLVWQDTESISSEEGWVDTNFGVDASGNALFLDINGHARLNFAEVAFENGQIQVVDFNESAQRTGIYRLLDFADGRHVKTVRILAKSEADESKLAVYLSKN